MKKFLLAVLCSVMLCLGSAALAEEPAPKSGVTVVQMCSAGEVFATAVLPADPRLEEFTNCAIEFSVVGFVDDVHVIVSTAPVFVDGETAMTALIGVDEDGNPSIIGCDLERLFYPPGQKFVVGWWKGTGEKFSLVEDLETFRLLLNQYFEEIQGKAEDKPTEM